MAVSKKIEKSNEILKAVDDFLNQGGSHPEKKEEIEDDHRITLRVPKWLLEKMDEKRKSSVGKISRNLWILQQMEKGINN